MKRASDRVGSSSSASVTNSRLETPFLLFCFVCLFVCSFVCLLFVFNVIRPFVSALHVFYRFDSSTSKP